MNEPWDTLDTVVLRDGDGEMWKLSGFDLFLMDKYGREIKRPWWQRFLGVLRLAWFKRPNWMWW